MHVRRWASLEEELASKNGIHGCPLLDRTAQPGESRLRPSSAHSKPCTSVTRGLSFNKSLNENRVYPSNGGPSMDGRPGMVNLGRDPGGPSPAFGWRGDPSIAPSSSPVGVMLGVARRRQTWGGLARSNPSQWKPSSSSPPPPRPPCV